MDTHIPEENIHRATHRGDLMAGLAMDALDVMSKVLNVAAEDGEFAGLEYLANWMNGHDTVRDEDISNFEIIKARHRG